MKKPLTEILATALSVLRHGKAKAPASVGNGGTGLRQVMARLVAGLNPELAMLRIRIAALEGELATAERAKVAHEARLFAANKSKALVLTALGISEREIAGLSASEVSALFAQRVADMGAEQLMVMGSPVPEKVQHGT